LNEFCIRNHDLVEKYRKAKKEADSDEDEELKDINEL
jgi:hypothetical protein